MIKVSSFLKAQYFTAQKMSSPALPDTPPISGRVSSLHLENLDQRKEWVPGNHQVLLKGTMGSPRQINIPQNKVWQSKQSNASDGKVPLQRIPTSSNYRNPVAIIAKYEKMAEQRNQSGQKQDLLETPKPQTTEKPASPQIYSVYSSYKRNHTKQPGEQPSQRTGAESQMLSSSNFNLLQNAQQNVLKRPSTEKDLTLAEKTTQESSSRVPITAQYLKRPATEKDLTIMEKSQESASKIPQNAYKGLLLRPATEKDLTLAEKSGQDSTSRLTSPKLDNFITRVNSTSGSQPRLLGSQSPSPGQSMQTSPRKPGTLFTASNNKFSSSKEPTILDKHRSLSPPLISKKYYVSEAFESLTGTGDISLQFRENISQNYQSLKLVQTLTTPIASEIESRKVSLGEYSPQIKYKKTVVFDLDETLVHCNQTYTKDADLQINIKFPTGEDVPASVYLRPFAIQILKQLSRLCEVIVFTASHSCYAKKVVQELDPTGEHIRILLDRDHCIQTREGIYVKDLRVIGRDLSDVVLVDNALYSFGFQITNGIPIVSYYDGKTDNQLLSLYSFLINDILPAKDVRPVIAKYFRFLDWPIYLNGREAVKQLYESSDL